MPYGAFLATVREHGGYGTDEAERATETVLSVLGRRLTPETAEHLSEQLPAPLAQLLQDSPARPQDWGAEEFTTHIAEATGVEHEAAAGYARVVLGTVAEHISGGELNKLLSQLPSNYAALFGHHELTD